MPGPEPQQAPPEAQPAAPPEEFGLDPNEFLADQFDEQELAAINQFQGNPQAMDAAKTFYMLKHQYPDGPDGMPEEDRQMWEQVIQILDEAGQGG